jgi:RNA polymerase sigma factor (sigma-70 family)
MASNAGPGDLGGDEGWVGQEAGWLAADRDSPASTSEVAARDGAGGIAVDDSDGQYAKDEVKHQLEAVLGIPLADAVSHVLKVARHVCRGRRTEAQDLSQDVFVKLVDLLRSGRAPLIREPYGYLAQMTRHLYVDGLRGKQRLFEAMHLSIDLERDVVDTAPGLDERVSTDLEVRVVGLALQQLTAEQRRLIQLFHLEGLSIADCARELGKAYSTVRARLEVAEKDIRAIVRRIAGER